LTYRDAPASDGVDTCRQDTMGLCDLYVKNQEIVACKAK